MFFSYIILLFLGLLVFLSSSVSYILFEIFCVADSGKDFDSVFAKFEKSANVETTTKQQVQKAIEERQKELDLLKNRWNQHKSITVTSSVVCIIIINIGT